MVNIVSLYTYQDESTHMGCAILSIADQSTKSIIKLRFNLPQATNMDHKR